MHPTLGGVRTVGTLRQPKLLVLLAYLALEGEVPRRSVAERFWPASPRPLRNLSVALSTLRRAVPGAVGGDHRCVRVRLATDAAHLVRLLEAGAVDDALRVYAGPFLAGAEELDLGLELEAWLIDTREFLAERLRGTLLLAAERALAHDVDAAARFADAAYRVAGAPAAEVGDLERLHAVLATARHPTVAAVRREAAELGLDLAPSPPTWNLPPDGAAPVGPPRARALVGRDADRARIIQRLTVDGARLVTVHGHGGIGKTHLALQVAHDLRDAFAGGAAFVPLEDATEVAEVPFKVARALGRRPPAAREPVAALRELVSDAPRLVVLDNVEQVAGIASLLATWLPEVPRVALLATSRERLGLGDEVAITLEGLPWPEGRAATDVQRALAFDAVRLFVQHARRADARFVLDPGTLPHVVRVCRAVGGAPLGLELAAAWVRAVPLADLADELERDFELLRRDGDGVTQRHASAMTSFERSWQRLDERAQRTLAALAVFAAGCRLDDAVAVADASIPVLARLVDAALLTARPDGRYVQHPLVARYARAKLAAEPEVEADALDRHARRVLGALAGWDDALRTLRAGALERFEVERENVAAAWARAIATGAYDLVAGAALPLARGADGRAWLVEGQRALNAAADAASSAMLAAQRDGGDAGPAARALGRCLAGAAWLTLRLDALANATAAAESALELCRRHDDAVASRFVLQVLATARYRAGDYAAALADYAALAEVDDDPQLRADALGRMGLVAQALGADADARGYYEQALVAQRALGNVGAVATQLLNLGALDLNTDASERAEGRFEEALALARAHGYVQVIPVLLHNLANVACKAGRHEQAVALAEEALELVVASGERGLESGMLATLAWIELERGEAEAAADRAERALHVAVGARDAPAEQTARVRLGQVLIARGRARAARSLLADAIEHPATLTWARRLAQRLVAATPPRGDR